MFDFQEISQGIQGSGSQLVMDFNFSFESAVRSATVAIQNFSLSYIDSDHHIKDFKIGVAVGDVDPFSKIVTATVTIALHDDDGNRAFRGSVRLVAIVDREPTWIRLQSKASNQYVCAVNGGGGDVYANRTSASVWETFLLEGQLIYGGRVSFKTFDGVHYLQAPEDGTKALTAQGTWSKQCETFTIQPITQEVDPTLPADAYVGEYGSRVPENAQIVLQANNSMYVSVSPRTQKVNAAVSSADKAAIFIVHLP